MEQSFAKVVSFAALICLGWVLRRFGILKPEAFSAISGLVIYVTLPCVILTNLNGVAIAGDMLWVAVWGLVTNFTLLAFAWAVSRREKDTDQRDFMRLNITGYSCGPFAMPYVQAFYPSLGLLSVCMFDVGNVLMSGGGTYAIIAAGRAKTTLLGTLRVIGSKLMRSGPLLAFLVVIVLNILGTKLPDGIITFTSIGAGANTFLCMIMIGESISLSISGGKGLYIAKLLGMRWAMCLALALISWFCLPFEEEVRKAITLTVMAPIPAMNLIFTDKLRGDIAMAANLSSLNVATSIIALSVALTLFGAI